MHTIHIIKCHDGRDSIIKLIKNNKTVDFEPISKNRILNQSTIDKLAYSFIKQYNLSDCNIIMSS